MGECLIGGLPGISLAELSVQSIPCHGSACTCFEIAVENCPARKKVLHACHNYCAYLLSADYLLVQVEVSREDWSILVL